VVLVEVAMVEAIQQAYFWFVKYWRWRRRQWL